MIGRSGERGSGISVLAARHDDDDDIYIYIYIYAPPWGLSTLAKELSAAASVMQSSSKELSTLVADRV